MRRQPPIWTSERGFTLPELLIALVLASLVGMAAYTVFTSSSRSTVGQEDVTEAQQNVRVAMDRLAKDIRAAGFGLPDPPFFLSIGSGGLVHSSPVNIVNGGALAADSIILLGGGFPAGTLQAGADCNQVSNTKICLNAAGIGAFLTGGNFNTSRRYISLDGIKYIELANSQIELGDNKLLLSNPASLDRTYAPGTQVFIIQAVRWTLNTALTGCSAANPCLTRQDLAVDNEVFAQNIEDMQFAFSRLGSADFNPNDSSSDIDITAVRVNLVGRTRREVIQGGGVSRRPQLENRAAGDIDNYRRRVLTSVVKVRNPRAGSF